MVFCESIISDILISSTETLSKIPSVEYVAIIFMQFVLISMSGGIVGFVLGDTVGLGVSVGSVSGEAVGAALGSMLGLIVGVAVGVVLGGALGLGDALGETVGVAVGSIVDVGVGVSFGIVSVNVPYSDIYSCEPSVVVVGAIYSPFVQNLLSVNAGNFFSTECSLLFRQICSANPILESVGFIITSHASQLCLFGFIGIASVTSPTSEV